MKTLRKLFLHTKMSWLKVVVFAVVVALYTAAVLIIPATKGTSLANIGVSFECWIVFAVFITANCKKFWEAGLKVFVFFLISQPLIYLFQVPFSSQGWQLFSNYYYPRWFFLTLCTLPGGMIAWLVRRNDLLGALVLSVATSMLAANGVYIVSTSHFPHNLVTELFCALAAVLLILILQTKKRDRIVAFTVTLAALLASAFYCLL